ncbi:MAG: efflux RND transporter periplasmic adaptor subunit [Hymenobacter sp.]
MRLEPVRSEQTFSGQVVTNGDKTAKVFPLVGGVVEDLKVELGDHVTKGQVLAVVRSGEIADVQNQNSTAGDRPGHCPEEPGAWPRTSSRPAWQPSATWCWPARNCARPEATWARTNKQLGIYGVSKDGHYTIQGPDFGLYHREERDREHAVSTTASADSFFTIADLDQVWVLANVFEADIAKVQLGYQADITTLCLPRQALPGRSRQGVQRARPRQQGAESARAPAQPRLPAQARDVRPGAHPQYREARGPGRARQLGDFRQGPATSCSCTRARTDVETRPVTRDAKPWAMSAAT